MSLQLNDVRPQAALPLGRVEKAVFYAVAAIGVAAFLFLLIVPFRLAPSEDATMLFQYSRNLAQTGVISYYPHGPRAEGATDFLWMVLLAGFAKMHVQPFLAAQLFNAGALVCLPFVLAKIAAERLRAEVALFVMGAYAIMPQFCASVMGFSTLEFGLLLAVLVLCFLRENDLALAGISLVLCLFRPDGVVFAVPMMLSALFLYEGRWRRLGIFAGLYVLPGLVYFIWRWKYFGSLMPLPFLVKSHVERFAHVLVLQSVQMGFYLFVFTAILLFLLLRCSEVSARSWAVVISLLVVPTMFYLSMHLEQDLGHRVFIYLPIGMAILVAMNLQRAVARQRVLFLSGTALWFLVVLPVTGVSWVEELWSEQFHERQTIAKEMGRMPQGTVVMTEAGIIPYYSGWRSYDAWGLNTAQFSRHVIQPSDIETIQPDLIMLAPADSMLCVAGPLSPPASEHTWPGMIRNVVTGAGNDYDLFYLPHQYGGYRRAFGIQQWESFQDCWMVRRSSPLREGLESALEQQGALTAQEYLADNARKAPSGPVKKEPALIRHARSLFVRWTALAL